LRYCRCTDRGTVEEREGAMGKRLVTIATFDQAAQARLAKNALDEEGIQSAVNDENLVAMDWLLSNAVGGVKVQVWEEDADRAVAVLERKFGEHGEGLGAAPVAPEEFAAEAEAAPQDEGEESPPPPEPGESDAIAPPSEREEYARRLVFTSIIGLVLPPVAVYALYLLLNALFGAGELSPRGRLNLSLGIVMTLVGVVWFPFFIGMLLSP
jgi:hypothetical protein